MARHQTQLRSLGWPLALAFLLLNGPTSLAQEMAYTTQAGQKFAYRVEISAEQNDATEFLKGVVVFTVKRASGETATIGYFGGLTKTRKAKPGTSSGRYRPGFGPGGPRGPRGPSIFNNPFSGLTQTNNELVITPQGEVRKLIRTSQLPYLLGNLSIMFFEPLPEQNQTQWSIHNGVSITKGGGRSSRPPFFRPSPLDRGEEEQRKAASESTSYSIERSDEKLVVVSKSYKLNMPAGDDNDTSYEITGTGQWSFNRELSVPESLEFKQKLFVNTGNTSTTIPVTINYTRMSASELEAHQQQRQEAITAARNRREGKTGIPADEKKKILADLNSDDKNAITRRMVQLKIVKPHPDDKDIALLIQKHIDSGHRPLRVMAQAAWGKWSVLVEDEDSKTTGRTAGASQNENPFALPEEEVTIRTWRDSSGAFSVEAEFVALSGNNVKLKRSDGVELTVPLTRLSREDQQAARRLGRGRRGR